MARSKHGGDADNDRGSDGGAGRILALSLRNCASCGRWYDPKEAKEEDHAQHYAPQHWVAQEGQKLFDFAAEKGKRGDEAEDGEASRDA